MNLIQELKQDYCFTSNPWEAIFLFPDGEMMSGEFDCGRRGLDHNFLKSRLGKSWKEIHEETGVVRLVPETSEALIAENQTLTEEQGEIIRSLSYEIEPYC